MRRSSAGAPSWTATTPVSLLQPVDILFKESTKPHSDDKPQASQATMRSAHAHKIVQREISGLYVRQHCYCGAEVCDMQVPWMRLTG